jgi:signal transduction histidine kinase
MSDLLDGLRTAQDLARHIGQHPSINHQQALFLQHIERTAQRLYDLLAPIPNTHLAYLSLVPRMADELQEPLAVIYGYARMMLDQPTSFGDAYLPLEMQTHAETLYELGRALSQDLHNLTKDAFEARLQTRRAPAENIDLAELLNDYAPIWHYEMQMHDVDLNFHTEVRPFVHTHAYHLSEWLRHVLLTIAQEIEPKPNELQILLHKMPNNSVQLSIVCPTLHLSDEHLYILFEKQGRVIFRQQAKNIHAQLHLRRNAPATFTWHWT